MKDLLIRIKLAEAIKFYYCYIKNKFVFPTFILFSITYTQWHCCVAHLDHCWAYRTAPLQRMKLSDVIWCLT